MDESGTFMHILCHYILQCVMCHMFYLCILYRYVIDYLHPDKTSTLQHAGYSTSKIIVSIPGLYTYTKMKLNENIIIYEIYINKEIWFGN